MPSVDGHCETLGSGTGRISDLGAIGRYCQSLGYVKATANAAGVPKNTVASWRCVDNSDGGDGVEYKIDLHAVHRRPAPAGGPAGSRPESGRSPLTESQQSCR